MRGKIDLAKVEAAFRQQDMTIMKVPDIFRYKVGKLQ